MLSMILNERHIKKYWIQIKSLFHKKNVQKILKKKYYPSEISWESRDLAFYEEILRRYLWWHPHARIGPGKKKKGRKKSGASFMEIWAYDKGRWTMWKLRRLWWCRRMEEGDETDTVAWKLSWEGEDENGVGGKWRLDPSGSVLCYPLLKVEGDASVSCPFPISMPSWSIPFSSFQFDL